MSISFAKRTALEFPRVLTASAAELGFGSGSKAALIEPFKSALAGEGGDRPWSARVALEGSFELFE